MKALFIALAVFAGMLIPAQAGFNSTFKDHAGHPLHGAVVNFLVGLAALSLVLAGFMVARKASIPSMGDLAGAPWWAWLGGLCGATMVFSAILVVRPLGAAGLIACFVTGQLLSSVVIDHYGWLNIPRTPATLWRMVGVGFLVVGLVLVLSAPKAHMAPDHPVPLGD